MKSKLNCNIVMDLLPNYIEHVTTQNTNKDIEEHLAECPECKKAYQDLTKDLAFDQANDLMEMREVKDGLVKTKRMYLLKGILEATLFIALLVPGIVNLAIDGKFTWYCIVASSIILFAAIVGTALFTKKNKVIATFGTLTILVLPYLWILEVVINRYCLKTPSYWFKSLAAPLFGIWIVFLWISYCIFRFTKIKIATCIGIVLVIAIGGAVATNGIVMGLGLSEAFKSSWISFLSCGVCALIAFVIGFLQKNKRS